MRLLSEPKLSGRKSWLRAVQRSKLNVIVPKKNCASRSPLAIAGAEKILARQIDQAANSDIVDKLVAEL